MEWKRGLENINIRVDQVEEKNLWVRRQESWYYPSREQIKIEEKSEESLCDLWDTIKEIVTIQRSNADSQKRSLMRHVTIKLPKIKKNLKAAKEKRLVIYKG